MAAEIVIPPRYPRRASQGKPRDCFPWVSLSVVRRRIVKSRRVFLIGIARLDDGVLSFVPSHQVHLPAPQAAERPMRRLRRIGRQLAPANGACGGWRHFSLEDPAVDLLDDSPLDFASDLVDSDLLSPPDDGLVSAAALFLYESLR